MIRTPYMERAICTDAIYSLYYIILKSISKVVITNTLQHVNIDEEIMHLNLTSHLLCLVISTLI